MKTNSHHFFLLNPSPWPVLGSMCAFNFMFSLGMFFKSFIFTSMFTSVFMLTIMMFLWWFDYLKEFSLRGLNTLTLEKGLKMSMILFISSEVFFFFSFFWSYFHFFLSPGIENGFLWPPQGVCSFEALNVPFLNTLLLLSSGISVTLSHYYLNLGKKKASNFFLGFTIFLGLTFTFFQGEEYLSSFFSISDGNFGTSFFMLTGFHGLHVIIGSIFLIFSLFLSLISFSSSKMNFLSFELACWYWHFVDVVWIFLFFFLYFVNN